MMQVEIRKISELVAYVGNPKTHPKNQIDVLKKSLKEFGWTNPVLIDADDVVIAGHGRIEAALHLGMTEAPTIQRDDLTPEQVNAYRILDNKSAELGGFDPHLLAVEFEALQVADFDLDLTGFDAKEIARVFDPPSEDSDTAAEDEKTLTCPSCGHRFIL